MGDQQQPDLFNINASENEAREQPMDARAVEAAYRQLGLPTSWSSEQTETFLSLVTERLDAKAAQLSIDLGRTRSVGGARPIQARTPTIRPQSACTRQRWRTPGKRSSGRSCTR